MAEGRIIRSGRGRYALPGLEAAWRYADQLHAGVHVTWRALPADDVVKGAIPGAELFAPSPVTSLVRTVIDCCRDLSEVEALCVVDAALRKGVSRQVLLDRADCASRTGRSRVRRVLELGDGRSANAFETCLRHIVRAVAGLRTMPQVNIGPHYVDLADEQFRGLQLRPQWRFGWRNAPRGSAYRTTGSSGEWMGG